MFFQEFLKEKLTAILEKLISKKNIDLLKQNDLKFNVEISQKKRVWRCFYKHSNGIFKKYLISHRLNWQNKLTMN